MANKYLDYDGVQQLVSKLKTYISNAVKVTGVKGNAESTYRTGNVNLTAANVGAVATTGNETVAGNKTFSGTTTITPTSVYAVATGTVIPGNAAAIIQSPIPKYLWHDLWAFCRATTPKYYTTTDGTTWTEGTLNKNLFIHKEAISRVDIISSTISGSRWEWTGGGYAYCGGAWLVIGVAYSATIAKFDVVLESSSGSGDSAEWTTLLSKEGISANQNPIWIKTAGPSVNNIRLTITRNSTSADTTNLPIVSLRWLTVRWGDQGKGSEYEYPYQWNSNNDIYPIGSGSSDLGSSGNKWRNVWATGINASNINIDGIQTATANANRTVWFSDSDLPGRPVRNTKFQYNPSTDILTVGSINSHFKNDLAIGTDLNTVYGPGMYTGGGSLNITNKPSGVDAFGLIVTHDATGDYYTQLLFSANLSPGTIWIRHKVSGTWGSWEQVKITDTVTTAATTGTGNAVTAITASNGALTVTKGATFLTEHQDISGKLDKPSGGTVGQVLAKTETGCEWRDDVTLTASVVGEVLTLSNGYTATYPNADEVSY